MVELKKFCDLVQFKWQKDNSIVQVDPYVNVEDVRKVAIEHVKYLRNPHNKLSDNPYPIVYWIEDFFGIKDEELK